MIAFLDLDGTLIDSSERHHVLMESLVSSRCAYIRQGGSVCGTLPGKPFDAKEYMEFKASGKSGKLYLKDVLGFDDASAQMIQKAWIAQIETKELTDTDRLYPDALPFLENLKVNGYHTVYLTARRERELLEDELERLDIRRYADELAIADPFRAFDEKLALAERILKEHPGEEALIVGDSENEYDIALTLGIRSYILSRGSRNRAFWDEKGVGSHDGLPRGIKENGDVL